MRRLTLALILLAGGFLACASSHGGTPLAFSEADVPREPVSSSNWSLPADRAEEILRSSPYEIHAVQGAVRG